VLTDEIKSSIKEYASGMSKPVSIIINVGEHDKRQELLEFIKSISSITDLISFTEKDISDFARSPITFTIEVEGKPTGIYFSGIPSGHEFNSLILAILQSGGVEIKLEDRLKLIISNIRKKLFFETFVSLNCHNCPDVVQALNSFALLNKNITSEMIDGGLFQQIIAERDIQGVPSIYLNGELFASGRVEISSLIEKLLVFNKEINAPAHEKDTIYDVVVIGGGPAGISAAIYASRKGLKVSVIAQKIGGQLRDTLGIENFISVPRTTGIELTNAIRNHMRDYELNVKEHVSVEEVETGSIQCVYLSTGEVIKGRSLVIATGANWKRLNIPGEQEYIGNGVAYCPHCDGPFYKDKDVAVIGGGNSGVEAALDLAGIVSSVTIIEYLPKLNADQILIDQIVKRSNVSVLTNIELTEILATNGKVSGVKYKERDTKEESKRDVAGVFVQIGLVPNSKFVEEIIELNKYGEIIIDDYCNTSIEGIFACGDVTTVPYKQIISSMGEGSKAAIRASEYLMKATVN
tara:strand:+ start:235 stop:1794 length:1560 start_codon:yes stop_codon:yes gene_type:complete